MNNPIAPLLSRQSVDFRDLTEKLQICISDALPTASDIPGEYYKHMNSIINGIESIRTQISKNLSLTLNAPSTAALNLSDSEMKVWISSMEEKERIALLPDVSHKEYSDFISDVECCLSTWKSWGWKVPEFYAEVDYNEILSSITSKVESPKPPLTINNMLYWLLIQWIRLPPNSDDLLNFADIFARTYFYKVVDENSVGQRLILATKQVFADINDLVQVIPKESNFTELLEKKVLQYIVYKINTVLENQDGNGINFNALAGFEKLWNETFPTTPFMIHMVISKKACSLYLIRTQKAFEDLITKTDDYDKLNINLLYLMRTCAKTMYVFDRNHYIIRLFGIFKHYWRYSLEQCAKGKSCTAKIALLDEHWLFYTELQPMVSELPAIVKHSLESLHYFQAFEKSCLEESSEWKIILGEKLFTTIETWNADPIMKRYIKRYIRFYINNKLEQLLHSKRDRSLEIAFEDVVNSRNELSTIEGNEKWIEPLDIFINNLSHYIYQTHEKKSLIDGAITFVGDLSKKIYKNK